MSNGKGPPSKEVPNIERKAPFVSVQMIPQLDGDVKPLVLSPSDPSFISQIEGDLNDQLYCSKEKSRGRSR